MAEQMIIYDPERTASYGYWSCLECGSQFYGDGQAVHRPDCTARGYAECAYHFGPAEVDAARKSAETYGTDRMPGPLGPVSVALLRENGYGHLAGDAVPDRPVSA